MTTHVLMAVDASGSMYKLASDVRGGFNSYIENLKKDEDSTYSMTVATFNTEVTLLAKNVVLTEVEELDENNYYPSGNTALLDALGKMVAEVKEKVEEGDRVLVVVQTDGLENSSVEYRRADINKMIKDLEATGVWSFIYLGSGPNAWAEAGGMGFAQVNTVVVNNENLASGQTYSALSKGTKRYSKGASGQSVAGAIKDESGQ